MKASFLIEALRNEMKTFGDVDVVITSTCYYCGEVLNAFYDEFYVQPGSVDLIRQINRQRGVDYHYDDEEVYEDAEDVKGKVVIVALR